MTSLADKASTLLSLHTAPEILVLANVWDVVSAQVVAATPGVKALATASHSIASTFGYEDGENIPLELHLDMVGRIARDEIVALADGLGPNRLTVISVPGRSLPARELQELGVARVSTGPFTQRVALTALQDATAGIVAGGVLPEGTRALN